ncbi:hypothetical protein GCM10023200_05880 [Actinomycetospora chlora]|uniref:Uncharacterized protein n=1 Tax=Actinomycetospora chlora TaxID=663608 RepID=A0ABP9A8L2_9PSEU
MMITNRDLDVIGPLAAVPGPRAAAPQVDTGGADEFELLRDAPTAHAGWSLRCRREARVVWSMPLAPRGAAPGVRPGIAQAVAVRVLSELGVFVSGWNQLDDGTESDDAWRFVARRPRHASALV